MERLVLHARDHAESAIALYTSCFAQPRAHHRTRERAASSVIVLSLAASWNPFALVRGSCEHRKPDRRSSSRCHQQRQHSGAVSNLLGCFGLVKKGRPETLLETKCRSLQRQRSCPMPKAAWCVFLVSRTHIPKAAPSGPQLDPFCAWGSLVHLAPVGPQAKGGYFVTCLARLGKEPLTGAWRHCPPLLLPPTWPCRHALVQGRGFCRKEWPSDVSVLGCSRGAISRSPSS